MLRKRQSYSYVLKDPTRKQVTNRELKPFTNNHTWDIVKLQPNKIVIGYKWIFKLNFLANGNIIIDIALVLLQRIST